MPNIMSPSFRGGFAKIDAKRSWDHERPLAGVPRREVLDKRLALDVLTQQIAEARSELEQVRAEVAAARALAQARPPVTKRVIRDGEGRITAVVES